MGILEAMVDSAKNGDPGRPGEATMLLVRIQEGDSQAANELLPLVYDQLRAMAGAYFQGQRQNHTLQPTALVHEAYLKLIRADSPPKSRAHFCAVAATAMRQILMNHARAKRTEKRDAKVVNLTVGQLATPSIAPTLDLLALDEALSKLSELGERLARLIELRFFGGLNMQEVAQVLAVSLPTVERDWRRARAWLNRELSGE